MEMRDFFSWPSYIIRPSGSLIRGVKIFLSKVIFVGFLAGDFQFKLPMELFGTL